MGKIWCKRYILKRFDNSLLEFENLFFFIYDPEINFRSVKKYVSCHDDRNLNGHNMPLSYFILFRTVQQ